MGSEQELEGPSQGARSRAQEAVLAVGRVRQFLSARASSWGHSSVLTA